MRLWGLKRVSSFEAFPSLYWVLHLTIAWGPPSCLRGGLKWIDSQFVSGCSGYGKASIELDLACRFVQHHPETFQPLNQKLNHYLPPRQVCAVYSEKKAYIFMLVSPSRSGNKGPEEVRKLNRKVWRARKICIHLRFIPTNLHKTDKLSSVP